MPMPRDAENPQIHVALVEDDLRFKNAVVGAIQASATIKLVEVASTRAEGLLMLERPPADVLLVDLGLPDGSGIDIIRAACVKWPHCGVLVTTIFADETHVLQAIEAGASGYLLKDSTPMNMLDDIRSVSAGGSPISPSIARQILKHFRQTYATAPPSDATQPAPQDAWAGASSSALTSALTSSSAQDPPAPRSRSNGAAETALLSARETEVLELVTKGFTANEISEMMQVSRHTVLTFVRRIYTKLKVTSKAEAIYEARNRGLLVD
jgi:DNA-binding NarL/FixJ family response regulator